MFGEPEECSLTCVNRPAPEHGFEAGQSRGRGKT
jgi:hypothetical protein